MMTGPAPGCCAVSRQALEPLLTVAYSESCVPRFQKLVIEAESSHSHSKISKNFDWERGTGVEVETDADGRVR